MEKSTKPRKQLVKCPNKGKMCYQKQRNYGKQAMNYTGREYVATSPKGLN